MTTKRFKEEMGIAKFIDNQTGKEYSEYNLDEIVILLNELHDEKQSVIKWIDKKIGEIKPYNSELCRATLLELKEFLE